MGFLGQLHENKVIKIIFTQEIEDEVQSKSNIKDGYNSKNIIVDSITQGTVLAVCDLSTKNGYIVEWWYLTDYNRVWKEEGSIYTNK